MMAAMAKPKMVHVEVYRGDDKEPVFVCEVSERFPLSEVLALTNVALAKPRSPFASLAAAAPKSEPGVVAAALEPWSAEGTRVTSESRDTVGAWFTKQSGDELKLRLIEETR